MREGSKRTLVVGSVALDTVRTPYGREKEALGGSASFFSAAARFFAPIAVVAVVGKDFPRRHLSLFRGMGIDTSGVSREDGRTFRWKGYYTEDLNTAHTLKTELNVFSGFKPVLSAEHSSRPNVFLANIDPDLQAQVLSQMNAPKLVACDTMNYWIQNKKRSLLGLLKSVHIMLANDAEARELSGERNLIKAARWIRSHGPRILVIKKGEHGVLCFWDGHLFAAPAYLLEDVFDPTGAGDSFAGGFIGSLAGGSGRVDSAAIRRAVVYGSVLASYNVQSFSLRRLARLTRPEVERRYDQFRKMTAF